MYGMPPVHDMSMGMGAMPMPMSVQPNHQPPPKRERKRLEIVDPRTGKPIVIGNKSSSVSSTDNSIKLDDGKVAGSSTSTSAQSTPQKKELSLVKEPMLRTPKTESESQLHETENSVSNSLGTAATGKNVPSVVAEPEAVNGSCLAQRSGDLNDKDGATSTESNSIVRNSGSSTKISTTATTTTTSICGSEDLSFDIGKTDVASVKHIPARESTIVSPEKMASVQKDPIMPVVQYVHEDRMETPVPNDVDTTTKGIATIKDKITGKATYSLEALTSFRDMYKDIPNASSSSNSDWPSMDITSEVAISRGGSRGGRSGVGWERGERQPGGSGRGSRGGAQWTRSQDLPKRGGRGDRGGRGGRGSRGGPPDPPLLDGPVQPLSRSANRWIPTKNVSILDVMKKNVNGIMNKMTREKFDRLAGQLTSINMESLEMLQTVIKIIFDKAVSEPNFCDMYADLCVHLEANWQVWSFLKIVQNDDDGMFYWTAMSDSDSEVVGPFDDGTSALESASGEEFEPIPAPTNIKLSEVRVRDHKFIKIWVAEDPKAPRYYWSGQDLDDLGDDQVLNGPHESHEVASRVAIKTSSFKRILLNACQEEFERDNIYEELEQKFTKDKEEGKITPQMEAEYEEKRLIMKLRMLGNIRFIGELYRKGMLQERIMHECIMKLMDVRPNSEGLLACLHPNNPPDEESIESLVKLLTTMGKDLDKHGAQGCMPSYFRYLEAKLVKDKRLSSRITFMIKDVIELRQHRWEPRRKELKQKTLNEIRKEAEREARAPPSSAPSGGGRDRDERDHLRSDRRTNSYRDSYSNSRSTMAPVYQQSQSMSSRGSNKQMALPRGFGARDDSVKTGPSGRPAAFGVAARQARTGAPGAPASSSASRRSPVVVSSKKPQSLTPVAIAIPSLDDETLENIGKKAKSIAEEYALIADLKEAEACLAELQKEYKQHEDVNRIFAFGILKNAIDAKAEIRKKMMELLYQLSLRTHALSFVSIRYAIKKTIELCSDLWCDVPKLHEYMSDFVVHFIMESTTTGVSLDWMLGSCLQAVDIIALRELVDGGFLAAVIGEILKNLKSADAVKAKKGLSATNLTLLSIFPSFKQSYIHMQEWIKMYEIADILALDTAFGLVERVSQGSSYDEIVAFITLNIPDHMRNDPFFATHACIFILNLSKEGELPSAERCMLLMGFCGNTDTQVRLVSALMQTRNATGKNCAFYI